MPLMRRGPGLVGTAARTGVAMGVAGRVRHRQEQKWAAEEQAAVRGAGTAAARRRRAAPAAPDYTAELEQLAKLRDDGVISPEDFEAKKKQILGI